MKTIVMVSLVVCLLAAAVLGLTACGSATTMSTAPAASPSASATTSSVKAAGATYLAVATKLNKMGDAFVKASNAWPASETGAQAEVAAQPWIAALKANTATLTNYPWPSDATSDVHTLIGSVGTLTGDLESLSSVDLVSSSSWASQFTRDSQALTTDAALVRHDLGLPSS